MRIGNRADRLSSIRIKLELDVLGLVRGLTDSAAVLSWAVGTTCALDSTIETYHLFYYSTSVLGAAEKT